MADHSSKANAVEAERSKSEALAAAEKGSPVVTLLAKRIRAAKKRLGKIESMEKLRDSGKPMNADQVGCSSMLHGKARALPALAKTWARLGPGSSSCLSNLARPFLPLAAWPLHCCSEAHWQVSPRQHICTDQMQHPLTGCPAGCSMPQFLHGCHRCICRRPHWQARRALWSP